MHVLFGNYLLNWRRNFFFLLFLVSLISIGINSYFSVISNQTFYYLLCQVIDEFDQDVHFVEIDIEEDPEIAEAAEIMGTPCVQFFKNKEMLRWDIFH